MTQSWPENKQLTGLEHNVTAFILELIYTKSIMSEVIKLDTLSVQCNYHLWVVFFVVLPKLFDQLKWELQQPLLVVHCCLEFSPSGQPALPHWEAGFHQRHWEHKTIKKQKNFSMSAQINSAARSKRGEQEVEGIESQEYIELSTGNDYLPKVKIWLNNYIEKCFRCPVKCNHLC